MMAIFFAEWGPAIWAFVKIVYETKSLPPSGQGKGMGLDFWLYLKRVSSRLSGACRCCRLPSGSDPELPGTIVLVSW